MALPVRLVSLPKLWTAHGQRMNSRIVSWAKPCKRSVLILNVRKMCHVSQSVKLPSIDCVTRLKCGLAFTLVSLGTYTIRNRTNVRFTCDFQLDQFIPFRIRAQCQDDAMVNKPREVCQQLMEKGMLTKLIGNLRRKLWLFFQLVKMSWIFGPFIILYPLTLLSGKLHRVWLKALFYAVQSCGPIYIKLGQWASTRRDLFTAEFCEIFSQLHYSVHPHEWLHTEQALRTAYGKRWHEVLKIDKKQKPLGSGCVAQVYKGYIHVSYLPQETLEALEDSDTLDDIYFRDGVEIQSLGDCVSFSEEETLCPGEDDETSESYDTPYEVDPNYMAVAVKVLHPNIREQFSRDLSLMLGMARFLETIVPSLRWVNLIQCVQEFSISMTKQMDMVHEARCLKRFHSDFADMPSVRIPVPVMSLARRNILVESFEEGQPMGDFILDKEEIPKGLRQKLADIGVDALLHMVFVKNFVHGDLHPGNILVQNANDFQEETEETLVMMDVGDVVMTTVSQKECPVRLVLLDCGITASLGKEDRDKFNQVFTAVVKGQGEVVADLFLERSHHMECTDPEAFRQDMADIVNRARETTLQLSKLKVSVLLSEVFSVLSKHRIKLESNFATIILAIGILEGLGRSLDPDLDILSKASMILIGEVFRK